MTPPDHILRFDGIEALPRLPVSQPIRARFIPEPDITAHELAILLPYYLGLKPLLEPDWVALGTMTRHLERVVEGPQVVV